MIGLLLVYVTDLADVDTKDEINRGGGRWVDTKYLVVNYID